MINYYNKYLSINSIIITNSLFLSLFLLFLLFLLSYNKIIIKTLINHIYNKLIDLFQYINSHFYFYNICNNKLLHINYCWWWIIMIFLMNINQNISEASLLPHPMTRYCSCGIQVMQQKFCQQDFIFAAKRVSRTSKWFNTKSSNVISDLLPYRGEILKFRLMYNFRGKFVNYTSYRVSLHLHVIRGISCGVPYNFKFPRHRYFLISGYKHKNYLIVTSCTFWSPLESLTGTQIIGLFSGRYQNYCYFQNKCQIQFYYNRHHNKRSRQSQSNQCKIKMLFRECYDRYTVCEYRSSIPLLSSSSSSSSSISSSSSSSFSLNHHCSFTTSPYTISQYNFTFINSLPKKLQHLVKMERSFPNGQFFFCLKVKLSNQNPWLLT